MTLHLKMYKYIEMIMRAKKIDSQNKTLNFEGFLLKNYTTFSPTYIHYKTT